MTARLVFRPLLRWTDPVTEHKVDSPFKAGWAATTELLRREVDMLTDTDHECVIEVDTAPGNIRNDGGMRGDAKVLTDGVVVSFDSRFGPLRYATDTFRRASWQSSRMPGWQCNVRAIALALEALRRVDRYGVTRRGEQYTGWAALGSGIPMPAPKMTVDEAARLLHDAAAPDSLEVPYTALIGFGNERVVKLAYRAAAKLCHPDNGTGDDEMFKRVTEARDLLLGGRP